MDPTIRDNPDQSPADVPQRLGRYRVLHMLGRGGMGSVYMAVRDDDSFKRRVAIKVIRKGMDTQDVLRRFELERQIVTSLNHPNIARVFDAGQTEDGRPYVVMEYVEGLPIDVYCDRNRLSTADRVALFEKVCEAVHAAHQNLIVHRDLKPGNILVTPQGEPKLLDFGIAKILNPELASVTVVTGPEMRVMTPEYASPEQASGEPITTASDVYSLGVLLYELLTGQMPYSFKTRVREEVLRVVREVDPEAPSTRVTKAQEFTDETGTTRTVSAADIAKARSEQPARLRRQLQGDLDNIVLMAMHKSPSKRYRSAQALAEDLERHVRGFPVQARPESFAYSVSRLARRHKGRVIASAAVAVVALAGTAGVVWQAGRAEEERRRAEQQAIFATAQTARLSQVRVFASQFLEGLQTEIARTEGALAARQVLASTSIRILDYLGTEFPDDPQLRFLRSQAWRRVGDIQGGRGSNTGETDKALDSYTKAWELLGTGTDGTPTVEVLRAKMGTLTALADVERRLKKGDAGLSRLTAAVELAATAPKELASDDGVRTELAQVLLARARLHKDAGEGAKEQSDLDASLAIRKSQLADHPGDAEYLRGYGVGLVRVAEKAQASGGLQNAITLYRENLEVRMRLAERPDANQTAKRDVVTATKFLADAITQSGRGEESLELLEGAWVVLEQLIANSPDDARLQRDRAFYHESLARAAESSGDLKKAEQHFRAFVLTMSPVARSDATHQNQIWLAGAHESLAAFLAAHGSQADARRALSEAISIYERLLQGTEKDERVRASLEAAQAELQTLGPE